MPLKEGFYHGNVARVQRSRGASGGPVGLSVRPPETRPEPRVIGRVGRLGSLAARKPKERPDFRLAPNLATVGNLNSLHIS